MNKGVIFDLDQTLVDTSHLENLRKSRSWNLVYNQISKLKEYDNISEIIKYLNLNKIKVAVVSTSPSIYCNKVVSNFGWNIDTIIGYHDVSPDIKPHPKAYSMAINNLNLDLNYTIAVGDRDIDIEAANRLGIKSVACTWGALNKITLLNSKPTFIANTTEELRKYINSSLNV